MYTMFLSHFVNDLASVHKPFCLGMQCNRRVSCECVSAYVWVCISKIILPIVPWPTKHPIFLFYALCWLSLDTYTWVCARVCFHTLYIHVRVRVSVLSTRPVDGEWSVEIGERAWEKTQQSITKKKEGETQIMLRRTKRTKKIIHGTQSISICIDHSMEIKRVPSIYRLNAHQIDEKAHEIPNSFRVRRLPCAVQDRIRHLNAHETETITNYK